MLEPFLFLRVHYLAIFFYESRRRLVKEGGKIYLSQVVRVIKGRYTDYWVKLTVIDHHC